MSETPFFGYDGSGLLADYRGYVDMDEATKSAPTEGLATDPFSACESLAPDMEQPAATTAHAVEQEPLWWELPGDQE